MNKPLLILLFIISLNKIGYAQEVSLDFLQQIPLKNHFNTEDFEGGIQSWSIAQDSLGIIYVANNKGLLEFDGHSWRTHIVPETTRLRVVYIDAYNNIFVGGQGQIGYFSKKNNKLVYQSLNDLLPLGKPKIAETWKITAFNGSIYFNTESEIYKYNYKYLEALKLPGYMRYMHHVGDKLYAQFYGIGLYEVKNDSFIKVEGANITNDIVSIIPCNGFKYLLTREGEVFKLKQGNLTPVRLSIPVGTINDVKLLKSNEIAIGTQSNGLFVFDVSFQLKKHLTKNQGLSDRTVKALYEDNFNNLWVALNNGIDYLKFSLPFSIINDELGIEGTGYTGTNYKDKIYLGTNNGAFIQTTGNNLNQSKPFQLIQESNGQVYNFSNLGHGLFLNHNRGLFEIKDNKLSQIYNIGSWKVLNTKDSNIILGSTYRGLSFYKKQRNRWTHLKTIPSFDENIGVFEFEDNQTLWASHISKGIYKFSFDSNFDLAKDIERFNDENGFPSNFNINIYNLQNKLIYTTENGIYEYNNNSNSFEPNTFLNKLFGNSYISEIEATKNAIYYIQNQEIGTLVEESFGNYRKHKSTFRHVNHLINDDLSNISILDENNVLIGAKEGFILYNPKKEFQNKSTPKVLIKNIEIAKDNDSTYLVTPDIRQPFEINRNNFIKIDVAAPYFDGFEALKYSFKLSPLQTQWSNWNDINTKEFSHLPPGEYTLEVKALNIYENEGPVTKIDFTVITPWFLSNWAKFGYVLFILIGLTFIPILQRFHFKKEKSLINKRKDTALKIKDEAINKLETDKLKSEIDLKNDQLTSITMQLVKNNEFIQHIQTDIQNALEKNQSKKTLNKIVKNIDLELSHDHSWEKFAYHFDQVHGNYLEKLSESNIKLSPREIKLAAFLRMNMSSKEIAVMLNITLRGVELARYRLRKKLNLTREQNLVEYLIALDNK